MIASYKSNLNIKEWPDARDTDEDSDSSVGRPNDMPAAHHEVPSMINVKLLDLLSNVNLRLIPGVFRF